MVSEKTTSRTNKVNYDFQMKEKGQGVKDETATAMEATLAVLISGIYTGRGILALCELRQETYRKDP